MTRANFIKTLAGCAVTVAGAVLLAGCGGSSTEANSDYRGSYNGLWTTLESASDTGTINVSVDSHGRMTGSVAAKNGTVSKVDGKVRNDGNFDASVTRTGANPTTYSLTGRVGHQQVDADYISAIQNGTPLTDTHRFLNGMSGDFRATIQGTEYAGTVYADGGP